MDHSFSQNHSPALPVGQLGTILFVYFVQFLIICHWCLETILWIDMLGSFKFSSLLHVFYKDCAKSLTSLFKKSCACIFVILLNVNIGEWLSLEC